jgi:hypothetical protein
MRIKNRLANMVYGKNNYTQGIQSSENTILFSVLLIISFFTVLVIYFKANSPYDTGDGIVHYQIARYSWKYPLLFLDWWGKPFFTLVSSPFAQFGMKGIYIFQAMNAAIISILLYKIASKLKLNYSWTIPVFVFFAPVYFAVMNSGLVEIFFGTIFTFSAWLVFKKKYYASALVASLLPYVRPEAYVVLPLLFVIYIYRRKFLAIPMLLSATILYSVIGYFHFKDIFWVINQNYKLVGDSYAGMKGDYFHYFKFYYQIWGTVYAVLLILGIGIIITHVFKLVRGKSKYEFVEEVFLLFLGNTVGCFVLHSLLYAVPGILNNLGMIRYLATLIPSSAIIALIGLNIIDLPKFNKTGFFKPAVLIITVILIFWSPFTQWFFPFRPNQEQIVMKQMANYIQKEMPDFKKIYFFHPLFPFYAELDPYDLNKVEVLWSADMERLKQLPDSTLILWDSHFLKGEGRIPFEWLSENPNYIMLKHYGYIFPELWFETCLFIRADNPVPVPVPVELVHPDGKISRAENFR